MKRSVLILSAAVIAVGSGCTQTRSSSDSGTEAVAAPPIQPDARLGRSIAEQQCARCHAIDLADASAVAQAPPLRDLYKRYAIEDLRGAFVRGIAVAHTSMPTFQLSPGEVNSLLLYLRSLDPCAQPASDREAMARCFEPL